MTSTGANRNRYANAHRDTDPRPSRFTNAGEDYTAWAARADAWAAEHPATFLPDVGTHIVHGIVNLHPPMIQCDGCGHRHTGDASIGMAVLTSGIFFNPRAEGDNRRMCADCWHDAGWVDDNLSGWLRIDTEAAAR